MQQPYDQWRRIHMVPAGFENAGVPGSSPGVAIEDDERRTQP